MSRLVESARKYIGVPFRHRGRSGKNLDCAGLVLLSARDIGVVLPDIKHYGREPFRDGLLEATRAAFGREFASGPLPIHLLLPGDVLLLKFDIHPHHVGLVGDHPLGGLSLIHANADVTQNGKVVEQRLDAMWLSRITHVFRTGL